MTAIDTAGAAQIPTPDEFAAMTYEQRQEAFAAMDVGAMSHDEQMAYVRAAMTAPPAARRPCTVPHIRQPIARKRGNGYYRPTYGPSEDGSRTLCGAEAGLDFDWCEGGRLPNDEPVCGTCKTIRARGASK